MANVAGQVMTIPSSAALLCGQDGQMYFPGKQKKRPSKVEVLIDKILFF